MASSRWGIALVVACLVLLAGGAMFYRAEEESARRSTEAQLEAVAQLKAGQIMEWRNERLNDATDVMGSLFLIESIADWLTHPDEAAAAKIRTRLRNLQAHQHFSDILLADWGGSITTRSWRGIS